MRTSTPEHWDRFWTDDQRGIEEVYSNEERILEQLEDVPLDGGKVLEVGAGSGRDSIEIARRGAEVFLVDYVMSAFGVIRAQAESAGVGVHCVCADARALPFREGAFDLVFHQGLLEHFRDPTALLRENHRVTCRGGYCLIDVPQRFHPYTIAKHLMIALGRWFAGWETEFSPSDLRRLVSSVGFEVCRIGGDWMVPGFWYRSLRYGLMRSGIARLP
ncbi:MAG: methyltransferase domain-containing protein, partial [Candidatus Eisenbacteria sp.]|nr:methyltransferase domain-containing protein [Candidatus Eisenbacteria bacterium]